MTNAELQMIGIDEATFRAASEEQRVEWGKQNTTALFGLCEEAKSFLKCHSKDIWMVDVMKAGWNADANTYGVFYGYLTYRLSPDYQPPVKRWWFDPIDKAVHFGTAGTNPAVIEVTADYAAYLQAKPEIDAELREVELGDSYYDMCCKTWVVLQWGIQKKENTPTMRWCKPRKVSVCRLDNVCGPTVEIPYAEAKKWGLA